MDNSIDETPEYIDIEETECMNAYVRANKRKIICEEDITLDRAIDFLAETKDGLIISDGKEYTTIEELEYVKSIRSLPGIGSSDLASGGREVHEDSHRELFESAKYNAEQGTECDN